MKTLQITDTMNTNSAPKGVRDKTYKYFGCSKAEYDAANPPNKAQPRKEDAASHSPLPWRTVVETEFEPCAVCSNDGEEMVHLVGGSIRERACNQKLIVRAVNGYADLQAAHERQYNKVVALQAHADKLAEELRKVLFDATHGNGLQAQIDRKAQAKAALAAWEAAQNE